MARYVLMLRQVKAMRARIVSKLLLTPVFNTLPHVLAQCGAGNCAARGRAAEDDWTSLLQVCRKHCITTLVKIYRSGQI